MNSLYPEIQPFHSFFLPTGGPHEIYVEQAGNPAGLPVVFLHGGPCSGCRPDHRRFFDPGRYRIILFDQRGSGRSRPFGELRDNTTQHLLADMEAIRQRLGIRQWLLFGGSWGGALALLYAQQYPERVSGMILRGVFLARQADMDWFLRDGAKHIYPGPWQSLRASLPAEFAGEPLQGLCGAVFGDDDDAARRVARQWQLWSGQVALGHEFIADDKPVDDRDLLQVRMELHYARHGYFIAENRILDNCRLLQHIPAIIIHGQYDLTCPLESGWLLHQALPASRLQVLNQAGHVARGEQMLDALVAACNEMADQL